MIDLNTNSPLTFKEFRQRNLELNSINDLRDAYKEYLEDYNANRVVSDTDDSNYRSNLYKEYLKNVNVDNLKDDVAEFLKDLDYDDEYELELAVDYFVKNIKTEIIRLRGHRDEIKYAAIKNNLKASVEGVKIHLKNFIIRLLNQEDFLKQDTMVTESINVQELSNKIAVNFVQYVVNDSSNKESEAALDFSVRTDFDNSVKEESKDTIQLLKVDKNGSTGLLKTRSGALLSINNLYTDPLKLPGRFFGNEDITLEKLTLNLKDKLIEKYLSSDVYYLSGDGVNHELKKIYTAQNPQAYYTRYNPVIVSDYGNLVRDTIVPNQLSYQNSALAYILSRNLTYNVDVSAVSGEYYLPDPNKVESGLGFRDTRNKVPINFSSENDWVKNNEKSALNTRDNRVLKFFGYQSKENSLDYTPHGINKVSDNISFWSGVNQNIWENDDVYERDNLNQYPEAERLEDLLVTNSTPFTIKTDSYGNEFIMYKDVFPKRYAGDSYITSSSATSTSSVSCSFYDALYFDATLSAICAADPSSYDSLSSIYDQYLVNDKYDYKPYFSGAGTDYVTLDNTIQLDCSSSWRVDFKSELANWDFGLMGTDTNGIWSANKLAINLADGSTTESITLIRDYLMDGQWYEMSLRCDGTTISAVDMSYDQDFVLGTLTIASLSTISVSSLGLATTAYAEGYLYDIRINDSANDENWTASYRGSGGESSDWSDRVGSNDGTVVGSLSTVYKKEENIEYTKRMFFDGVNDSISISNHLLGNGEFIEWKMKGGRRAGIDILIDSNRVSFLTVTSSTSIRIRNTAGVQSSLGTGSFDSTIPHTFRIERSSVGGTVSLYIDGEFKDSDTASGNYEYDAIGGDEGFSGSSDESTIIYDVNLNDEHFYRGYGNTNADWEDQIGSSDGTVVGSPRAVYILKNSSLSTDDQADFTRVLPEYDFAAPLSLSSCSAISGDDLVDGGPFLDHPCTLTDYTSQFFNKNSNINLNSVSVPATFSTSYESSATDATVSAVCALYGQNYETNGSLYVRDVSSQKVYTFWEKLSGVFLKLPTSSQSRISSNEVENFDVVGNTLYLQTSADTFTESFEYDGTNFTVSVPSNSRIAL